MHHLTVPQSSVIEFWTPQHQAILTWAELQQGSILYTTEASQFRKAQRSPPEPAHPVLTPGQYHFLNSWLEWTSQNDWSYCYVLFLHFQMPAIKQNELIFNQIKYVNTQLSKLFCSLFRFPLASRTNSEYCGNCSTQTPKRQPRKPPCSSQNYVYYLTHAVKEGNNTFRYFRSTGQVVTAGECKSASINNN